MRVKIGDAWFSADDQPICVELTEQDKENIANMDDNTTKYAVFPDVDSITADQKLDWMRKEQ